MDPLVAQRYLSEKKFSDLKLVIKDDNESISMDVHKIVLGCCSPYFDSMLLFNEKNGTNNIIIINADNAPIMRDVILSCYGIVAHHKYPEWYYILETFKCKHLLCIKYDINGLYNLTIPHEHFEYFLDIMKCYDLHNVCDKDKLIKMIKFNLPPNYDLDIFPEIISQELKKKKFIASYLSNHSDDLDKEKFSSNDTYTIKILDIDTGNVIHKLTSHNWFINDTIISRDGTRFVSWDYHLVKIWDLNTGKCIKTIPIEYMNHGDISENKLLIIIEKKIKLYDVENGICLNEIERQKEYPREIRFSNDNDKIFVFNDYSFEIWNSKLEILLHTIKTDYNTSFALTTNSKIIAIGENHKITLWDANSGENIRRIPTKTSCVWALSFSPDDNFLAANVGNKIYLWNTKSWNVVGKIRYHKHCGLVWTPDGKKLLLVDGLVSGLHKSNNISILDPSTMRIIDTIKSDYLIKNIYFD